MYKRQPVFRIVHQPPVKIFAESGQCPAPDHVLLQPERITEKMCIRDSRYMSFVVQQPPTYKQFINNLEEKMLDPDFLGDTQNLISPDREFNPRLGYELVLEKLIERMRK